MLALRSRSYLFGFRAYDKDDLRILSKAGFGDRSLINPNSFCMSPTNGRVAIHFRGDGKSGPSIRVYSDYTLQTALNSFSTDDFPVFFLTDDDKIIINGNNRNHNKIYDINTGTLLNYQTEDTGTDFRPAISADGKYIFNYLRVNNAWYKLYRYENGVFNLITYRPDSRIKDIVFNPKKRNHVVMQSMDNYFSIYEVPGLNRIATIEGEFVCFDSFTGNILYLDKDFGINSQLNVLNDTYNKTIFKVTTNLNYYGYYSHLINNYLIVRNYYINIVK